MTKSLFTITRTEHRDCAKCEAQAPKAATTARFTGSTGATHTEDATRTTGELHSATVRRVTK